MAKTKKDLAKYLADYIEPESETIGCKDGLSDILKQGLDAFESTEGVKVRVEDDNNV